MARGNSLVAAPQPGAEEAVYIAELLDSVASANEEAKKKQSEEERIRAGIRALLGTLGAQSVGEDALVFEGERFVIPASYGGDVAKAVKFLQDWQREQSVKFDISRTLPYRPYDGAHAFMVVMKRITGSTGFGKTRQTMFGPEPPEFKTIDIAFGKTTQVPWSLVNYPMFEATFDVGYTADPEKGYIFSLTCNAPKRYRRDIEAIFRLIEMELADNSIYRGKAITGAEWPEFMDTRLVDASKVVYSEDVLDQLNAHVWAPVRYSQAMRDQGISLKRAVLFAGPYGTGKSLGAALTAQEAVANGWTFIMCRTGKDDPATVMKTAELYAPAVVVVEDIDVHAAGHSAMEISVLLDMLDGVTSKGKEVVALFTTNFIDRIQKGALRPGRIDAVIKIAGLDPAGFRKLITISLGPDFLEPEIDWERVSAAYEGFLPAFVKEAALRAQRYTMARHQGVPGVITTEDLCHAADSLRPQLELMEGAKEGARRTTFEDLFRGTVEGVNRRTSMPGRDPFEVAEASLLNGSLK